MKEPSYDESEYDYAADNDYSYDEKHSLVEPTSPLSESQLGSYHTSLGFSSELAYSGPTGTLKLSGSQFGVSPLPELPSVDHSSAEDDQMSLEPATKRRKLTELGLGVSMASGHLSPSPPPFSDEDDAIIVSLHEIKGEDWVAIAAALSIKRDPGDVKDRWRKLREKARRKTRRVAPSSSLSSSRNAASSTDFGGRVHRYPINKRFWSAEEDAKLRELVELHGAHNWPKIAQHMEGRSDNDCHSRWSRHLDPRLNKQPFSPEEDAMILELQRKMGNHWKDIAVALNTSRSGVQIHGRWLHLSKKERKANPVAPAPAAAPTTKPKRGRKPGSTNANRINQTKIPKKRGRRPKALVAPQVIAQPPVAPPQAGVYSNIPRIHVETDAHQDGAVSAPESYLAPGHISSTEEFSGDWANEGPAFDDEYGMMSDSGIAY